MTLLIVYAVLAVFVSFLCSLLEACLLSVPRSYVEALVAQGSRAALSLQAMKSNIDNPLAAILTLNTIAHTVGAAGVGAQTAGVLGSNAVGVVTAVMTLIILVFSEIVPKTLGAVYCKALALPATRTIQVITVICMPLIVPLEWANRLIGYPREEERLERAELLASIRLGQRSGILRQREYQIASNLMALAGIRLADVLTPRTVIFSLPREITVKQALDENHPIRYARIPVYADNPEDVTGYVPRFAIHAARSAGREDQRLKELARPISVLPEFGTVADALETFIKNKQQIALVVDEYGGLAGIVTLEDLLESLLGEEIVDETDTVADLQEWARKRRDQRSTRS